MIALVLPSAGCSFSYQLGSLLEKGDPKPEHTGSIRPKTIATSAAVKPSEGDLVYARAAAVEVVAKTGRAKSAPWENPRTGARGTVTPITSAYASDGTTCRDFLASYVSDGSEAWLEGAACRADGKDGKWVVRHLRPWKQS